MSYPYHARRSAQVALLIAGTLLWAFPAHSQEDGRIVGRVISTQTGEALASAQVFVATLQIGAVSSLDGRFLIQNVPPGTHEVRVELLGYAPKTVANVVVEAGGTSLLDVALEPQALALEELVVSASVERGNTAALLGERQKSALVVGIGSQILEPFQYSHRADRAWNAVS